ncbi:hypothetical protein BDY19DRAFT_925585 [Irpex rosettiformis]|uniref:Uncharacterized protein n=1 Tax=Irpex rosettiformis TaxID=378272 RepID=A0ACB8UEK1_9APHY|nr:hypothetical protein BDY19DRAFT_925585 [Irpex rosettiformis]
MGAAAKILAEQLQHYRDGDALWDPMPPDGEELRIGDVGMIDQEGAFVRLFNTIESAKRGVNRDGVPDGFEPLVVGPKLYGLMKPHRSPGPLTSSSIKAKNVTLHAEANAGSAGAGAKYAFSCSSEYGAWVLLKDFSHKEYLRDSSATKRYILDHHDSWYNFASTVYTLDCKPYDIIFVKGFVKTSAWSVAAYRGNPHSEQMISLSGSFGGIGSIGFDFDAKSSEGYLFDSRYGPGGRDIQTPTHFPRPSLSSEKGKGREQLHEDNLATASSPDVTTPSNPSDQSVFVSYYKVKQRIWWMKRIVANAGPHELPRGPHEDSAMAVLSDSDELIEEVPAPQERHLPIDDLLDYIFENSDAEVAIASHDDLADLFPSDFWPQDVAAWLKQERPGITVDGTEKFGYISSRETILRRHTQALLDAVAEQDRVAQEEHDRQYAIVLTLQTEQQPLPAAAPPDEQGEGSAVEAPSTEATQEQPTTEPAPQEEKPQEADPPAAPPTDGSGIPPVSEDAGTPPSPKLPQPEELSKARSSLQGRDFGSFVQTEGQIYLGNGGKNRYINYPHMFLADHVADGCSIPSLTMSFATNRIASTCEDRAVRVWDLTTGALLMKLDGHTESSCSVAFSPDGTKLVSGGVDNMGILWNLNIHAQIARLEGHTGAVWTCDYSPDGNLIATGSTDNMVKVWDGIDGKPLYTIQDHPAVVMSARFSPDSKRILSCAENNAYLWNASDGSALARLEGHEGLVWSAKFSTDGTRIVTSSEDHTARIWDAESGAELVTLAEHAGPVWDVAFSPDGEDVVLGSNDGTVAVCDSYTGEEKHRLEDDHPSIVSCVKYSRDGELIAAGCADGAVKLWNSKNGQFVAELGGQRDKAKNVMFTPDDCHLVSCSDDSTIRIWNVVNILQL